MSYTRLCCGHAHVAICIYHIHSRDASRTDHTDRHRLVSSHLTLPFIFSHILSLLLGYMSCLSLQPQHWPSSLSSHPLTFFIAFIPNDKALGLYLRPCRIFRVLVCKCYDVWSSWFPPGPFALLFRAIVIVRMILALQVLGKFCWARSCSLPLFMFKLSD